MKTLKQKNMILGTILNSALTALIELTAGIFNKTPKRETPETPKPTIEKRYVGENSPMALVDVFYEDGFIYVDTKNGAKALTKSEVEELSENEIVKA